MMSLRSSSLSSSLLSVVVGFSLVLAVFAQPSFDCGSRDAFNSLRPKFTTLSVFPNPVEVGQQAHIRTVVQLPENIGLKTGDIKDGTMSMELKFKNEIFASITGIPLCSASSSIVCSSLGPGDNAISFDYQVPVIPAGNYTVTLRIITTKNGTYALNDGCLQIDIAVVDPKATPDKFVSWIQAQLAGEAQFEHEDYLKRNLQEFVQVGPVGEIDPIIAYTFPWGTFISLKGSEDQIQPYFVPGGYVWGLHGEMEEITYQGTDRTHVYRGDFFVGYVTSLAKRALDIPILTGTFSLTWTITQINGVVNSVLSGTINFDNDAELPLGFSNPITVGRLGTAYVFTDAEGVLTMRGTETTCLDDPECNTPMYQEEGDDGMSDWEIGLIVAVFVGVALIFIVVISLYKWHRRSRRHEEEDGIFSATRKPEYGNALVVDDIIQETREHSPNMMPPLNRRGLDYSDSDTDSDDFSRSRSRSRTPSRSRSPPPYSDRSKSPSRSRSRSRSPSRSGSYSDSEDYTDAGSSASRA